ncbi:hypothetical protein [Kingella denitrificans]|uniref:hypothetical protein n=1 Tax=Kingella denitrificans TaxID=502 RepID=UPI0011D12F4D|nr:hypothetical protein [Kingella denitrificans]
MDNCQDYIWVRTAIITQNRRQHFSCGRFKAQPCGTARLPTVCRLLSDAPAIAACPTALPMQKAACTSVAGLQAAFCPPNPSAAPHGNAESSLHLPIFC